MKKKTKKQAPMSEKTWEAAVSLLMGQLEDSQTLFAQIVNDPSNPKIPAMIHSVFEMNKLVCGQVKVRMEHR